MGQDQRNHIGVCPQAFPQRRAHRREAGPPVRHVGRQHYPRNDGFDDQFFEPFTALDVVVQRHWPRAQSRGHSAHTQARQPVALHDFQSAQTDLIGAEASPHYLLSFQIVSAYSSPKPDSGTVYAYRDRPITSKASGEEGMAMAEPGREANQLSPDGPGSATAGTAVDETPTLSDFALHTYDKLRYADTDRQGHVNNAVFSTALETGRAEFLYDPDAP